MVNGNRSENVQAISQGECTSCERSDDNYTVVKFNQSGSSLKYSLRCSCGTKTTVSITPDGVKSGSDISHKNASWNYGESNSSEDDEEEDEIDQSDKSPI